MCVFHACDLGGSAGWIWDDDSRVWWSIELTDRRDAVIICRSEDHAELVMIAAYQGGWDGTRVGFEFIFEMV